MKNKEPKTTLGHRGKVPSTTLYDSYVDYMTVYQEQKEAIANFHLLGQMPTPSFNVQQLSSSIRKDVEGYLKPFMHTDFIVAGGLLTTIVKHTLDQTHTRINDVDLYFKGVRGGIDVQTNKHFNAFMRNRGIDVTHHDEVSCHVFYKNITYNLIYGIPFESPTDLISRFDFRACSISYDIKSQKMTNINGAPVDIANHALVLNIQPRQLSVKRLLKYIYKGYKLSPQQRHIFTELLLLQDKNYDEYTNQYEGLI